MVSLIRESLPGDGAASPKVKRTIVPKTESKTEGSKNMACASNTLPCLSLDFGPETRGPAGLPTSSFSP